MGEGRKGDRKSGGKRKGEGGKEKRERSNQ